MIQANVLKQVQWPILLVGFLATAGIFSTVSKRFRIAMSISRSFRRIADSTQNRVIVMLDYSLISVITPVCCSEAVMAASDVVIVVVVASAAAAAATGSSSSLFVNICRKGCSQKLKCSVFLLIHPLSLSIRDTHCQNLAMAKILKMLQFPIEPSVREENF